MMRIISAKLKPMIPFLCILFGSLTTIVAGFFDYRKKLQEKNEQLENEKKRSLEYEALISKTNEINNRSQEIILSQEKVIRTANLMVNIQEKQLELDTINHNNTQQENKVKFGIDKQKLFASLGEIKAKIDIPGWLVSQVLTAATTEEVESTYNELTKHYRVISKTMEKEFANRFLIENSKFKLCFDKFHEILIQQAARPIYGPTKESIINSYYRHYYTSDLFKIAMNGLGNMDTNLFVTFENLMTERFNSNYFQSAIPNE